MQHLIIFAHPNSNDSFGKAIVESVVKASHQQGVECTVRELYTMAFNPILSFEELQASYQGIVPAEIRYEHQLIQQADLITLIYPVWWMGFPAILKGYLDRVLTHGFAYKTENGQSVGLLQGKKMQQFVTLGNNVEQYQQRGFAQALDHCLVNGLFNYCGIQDVDHILLGDIHILDNQARQQLLDQVVEKTHQNLTALLSQTENT